MRRKGCMTIVKNHKSTIDRTSRHDPLSIFLLYTMKMKFFAIIRKHDTKKNDRNI